MQANPQVGSRRNLCDFSSLLTVCAPCLAVFFFFKYIFGAFDCLLLEIYHDNLQSYGDSRGVLDSRFVCDRACCHERHVALFFCLLNVQRLWSSAAPPGFKLLLLPHS